LTHRAIPDTNGAERSRPERALSDIEPEIICERRGVAGVVTLNRPKALNALTLDMVRGLAAALDGWEHDPAVRQVVVQGAGGKAFCAGGDIRKLYEAGRAGQIAEMRQFWREEYILNCRIKAYPKPYIALIDGIVMGGGVGVSLHGSHRVASEKYLFAMPEVGIGFFPDVGATYALRRLPGAAGAWLACTGERIGQGDAVALGLATHAAASADMPALLDALCAGSDVDAALARFAPAQPPPATLHAPNRALIDRIFSLPGIEAILNALDAAAAGDPYASALAKALAGKSPTSMKIAHEQMRIGGKLSFTEAMRIEYRIVSRIAECGDFYEGVRAVIVDKDHAPRWSPATSAQVSAEAVAAYFAPLPDELVL
jgi:enoyl-CoA hydratase